MSSQTPTWEVVEEAIENVRKALNEQAECLTAQAATLDSWAVQVKKCRDGHQTTESEQCPIDCMNQIANLLNQRMNKMDQGFSEINTKMLATLVFPREYPLIREHERRTSTCAENSTTSLEFKIPTWNIPKIVSRHSKMLSPTSQSLIFWGPWRICMRWTLPRLVLS